MTDAAGAAQGTEKTPALPVRGKGRWLQAIIISTVVGLGFWWLLRAGALPIVPPPSAFEHVSWGMVWVYAGMWIVIHTLRCSRWYFLLRPMGPVSFHRPLLITLSAYAAQVILPFRMGEAVRPAMIARRGNVSWLPAAGTVVAERIVDGAFLSVGLGVALLSVNTVQPLPTHLGELPLPSSIVRAAAATAAALFLGLCLAMWVFHAQREWAQKTVRSVVGRVSGKAADFLIQLLARLSEGLSFLAIPRYSLWFVGLTAAYWVAAVAGMQFLFQAVGLPEASLLQTTVVLGVLGLGVAVPNAPGFFGSFQIGCYAALVMFFPTSVVLSEGSAYVFLLYVIQLSVTFGLGILAFLAETVLGMREGRRQAPGGAI